MPLGNAQQNGRGCFLYDVDHLLLKS